MDNINITFDREGALIFLHYPFHDMAGFHFCFPIIVLTICFFHVSTNSKPNSVKPGVNGKPWNCWQHVDI